MLFGHAALASIAGRTVFDRVGPLYLLAAAYGPDFVDKPLKFFFHAPGHGMGHTGVFFVVLCLAVWLVRDRLGRLAPVVLAALFLWAAHLLCDWVVPEVFFWPLFGFALPNPHPESTLDLASRFYSWPDMHPLAWIDLFLCACALGLRMHPKLSLPARPRGVGART